MVSPLAEDVSFVRKLVLNPFFFYTKQMHLVMSKYVATLGRLMKCSLSSCNPLQNMFGLDCRAVPTNSLARGPPAGLSEVSSVLPDLYHPHRQNLWAQQTSSKYLQLYYHEISELMTSFYLCDFSPQWTLISQYLHWKGY